MRKNTWIMYFAIVFLGYAAAASAAEDSARVQALTKQVKDLSDQVAELKSTVELLNAIRPDVATLMPDISERFHVMHYAGDAQDWALAAHELAGIERLIGNLQRVDQEKGAMAEGFLHENFQQLDDAIDHGDGKSFDKALGATVASCNGCHVAVGSPSMKVVLDTSHSLSLRHSHALQKSDKPAGHDHDHTD